MNGYTYRSTPPSIVIAHDWRMFSVRRVNADILVGGVLIGGLSIWLVRSQATIDDVSYEGHDSAPFHRDSDERTRSHL
jgi:hypothetical protein